MDDYYFEWIVGGLILSLLIAGGCGLFKLGKWQERRDYTSAFIKATEMTYQDGYNDGQLMGRNQGLELGKTEGYEKCLKEDFKLRDQY